MGIDPSLTSTGYAFVRYDADRFHALEFGTIETSSTQRLPGRLAAIFQSISALIEKYHPHEVAVEDVFYAKNAKSALMMGQARGATLVAAANHNLPVAEYSAREIKLAVSGFGNASKEQVRRMVLSQIELAEENLQYDVSDAFAVAICHCHRISQPHR